MAKGKGRLPPLSGVGNEEAPKLPKKKREVTPRSPKVSQAAVDAPPAPIPEELQTVWDDAIAEAFKSLRPQQQDFLIAYLNTGNAAEAYRRAYNPMAKDHLASVAGSRLLASVGIEAILAKFASNKTEVLFLVMKGYREMAEATKPNFVQDDEGQWMNAGDLPDWQARKEALTGLRKVHALDAAEKVEHSGKVEQVHSGSITIDTAKVADLLNGPDNK